jgi:DNA-binding NarL/FixJ family response regulator
MNVLKKPVNILIADNQFLITESLKYILHNQGGFDIINVVNEKSELLKALKKEDFTLLIIDHIQLDINGISELVEILKNYPHLKVLVISNSVSRHELHEFSSAGITNIILKIAGREELFDAIDSSLKGKKYYSDELLDLLLKSDERNSSSEEPVQLTASELEIVRLISEGLTTKEIASRKFISFHTVISHRKNIFRKLGVTSVSELIMFGIKSGWINTIEYYI